VKVGREASPALQPALLAFHNYTKKYRIHPLSIQRFRRGILREEIKMKKGEGARAGII